MTTATLSREGLHAIENASRDEIAGLQLERMKWSVRHAYENSPFYRKRFDDHGVHPDDLRTLADLAKFPFTVKQDLRDTYPFGMFAVPREQLSRIHGSSGTTGKPTVVGYTAQGHRRPGPTSSPARSTPPAAGPGDICHVAYGYGLFTGGLGAHYGAERLGCTVVPISGGMTERQVTLIQDFKPRIIMVTPSYMLSIQDEFRRQGLDPRESSLEVGIFGAEPWTNAMRQEIEAAFDMDAVDIYGLSEIMGPGVANECVETKDGLHVWEDHFYPEIIDPETGARPARRRDGRARLHHPHQGGPADDPLPHPRPDPAPARHRAHDAADGEGHRPLGRHDHPARRQRLPDPDRGADPEVRRPRAPLPDRARPQGPHGRHGRPRRGRGRARPTPAARAASAKELAHHIKSVVGVSTRIEVARPGRRPALRGQGEAGGGQSTEGMT